MRMLIQNKLKVAQNITLFNFIHKERIWAFIYLKCASRQKLRRAAGPFSVGDLFHQKSFTLTCSQTFSRHVTGNGTRLVSLEMENEMLRAIIMAPPSSCHWLAVCWGVISPHTSPIFLCPEESWPGKRNLTLASFLASFSRNQNQSSGVVSNYVRYTVKRLWHLVPTHGSSTGQRCWVHQQNHQVQCVEGKAPGSLPFNAFVHPHFTCPKIPSPTDFSSLHLETGGPDTSAKPPTSVCEQLWQ